MLHCNIKLVWQQGPLLHNFSSLQFPQTDHMAGLARGLPWRHFILRERFRAKLVREIDRAMNIAP